MAFRIRADETVEEAVQRIAREQIDKALAEVNDQALERHEAVHQGRKRCKKIRGLIRLVRPLFEDTYARENTWYRDSAQQLSRLRDAHSSIETFDKLMDHFQEQTARKAFSPVRQQLTKRRKNLAEDEKDLRNRLDTFVDRLHQGRERVAAWRLSDGDFNTVQGGLINTYARGRTAMKNAYQSPRTETFHEWRKRAKYHGYHLRLLRPIWQGPMKARQDEVDLLGDYLGADHDLSILRATLLQDRVDVGAEETLQALLGLLTRRQVDLRARAKPLGVRLYAEPPKRFTKRLHRYWQAWRRSVELESQTTYEPDLVTE